MSLHPCYSTASARGERSSAIQRVLLQVPRCDGREAREEARTAERKGRTEKRMKREWYITYQITYA